MYPSEEQFAEYLESQGKAWVYGQIIFQLKKHETVYRPDFYCIDNDTFYEVIGSRQAFYLNKYKLRNFIKEYPDIKFKIVNSFGKEYIKKENFKNLENFKIENEELILDEKLILKRERFSFWIELEDKKKLESIAKAEDLKIGHLIRKAIKKYLLDNN